MSETYSGTTNVQSKQADIAISTVMLLFGASNICVNDVSNTRQVCTLSTTQFQLVSQRFMSWARALKSVYAYLEEL